MAYHDRSDGGLWAAACEMAFAGAVGVELDVPSVGALFAEELGVVLGVPAGDLEVVDEVFAAHGLTELVSRRRPGRERTAGCASRVGGEAVSRRGGARPRPGVGRGVLAHRRPA